MPHLFVIFVKYLQKICLNEKYYIHLQTIMKGL
jgi:hypothetical protein